MPMLSVCGTGCSKSSSAIQSQGESLWDRLWVYADSWPGAERHHMNTRLRAFGRQCRGQFAEEGEGTWVFGLRRGTLEWSRSWSKETLPQGPLDQSP
jgi:hypothetical protein